MAVEAALIFPVLLLLALGIAEWSLVLRDQIELTSVSRAGARTASSVVPTTPSSDDTAYTQKVIDSIDAATSSLHGSLQSVVIYKAGAEELPLGGAPSCGVAPSCAKYDWDPSAGAFVPTGPAWDGSNLVSCAGEPDLSRVGVIVVSEHHMITGVWSDRQLIAETVMSVEPQRC